ncbi:hypothetical protein QBC39DRAFT_83891 [Podospora conica]|nr:hypothetical protein QBC39DRAFT_83891 [Schizothecium conicum]
MAKIKSFAPGFLNRPSPGHKLFEQPLDESKLPAALAYSKRGKPGPKRTIALRGAEVFVAVGKQIRWGNLAHLKESWESKQSRGNRLLKQGAEGSFEVYDEEAASGRGHSATGSGEGYRIIKTPVSEDIRQLVMSPEHDFLAVLTSHTVHICILPDSSHLQTDDETPFKPKFWTLGPTTHVTTRAPIASAIWHPLGVNGSCLVTVTEDAVVRLWELSVADRWSFDSHTLAIDLKRLADGTSLDQDFSTSTSATNQGFSPDLFDMEVAAACFPGRGSGGWSTMTLWIAMVGGDVYALCPLLPSRWSPPPTLLPCLSLAVVARAATTEDDPEVSPEAKILAQQQQDWMADLDSQEPKLVDTPYGDHPAEVYQRPSRPGIVPKLQGPFQLEASPDDEQDDEIELKDIYVIGERINTAALMDDDDSFDVVEDDKDGLSLSVICLLSTSGQVKICLDTEGVQAKWLPPRSRSKNRISASAATPSTDSLLTFQTFDTLKPAELTPDSWPMFSDDVTSRYSFYITHPAGITSVSLAPWISRLEGELWSETEAGAAFRIDLLLKGQGSEVERVYTQPAGQNALAAAVSLVDPDLGHLVLSATLHDPVALFFDTPEREVSPLRQETPLLLEQGEPTEPPVLCEPRPLFHPSEVLDQRSAVPDWHEHIKTGRRGTMLQQQVKLSVATLEVFTDGHRLVSAEVFELNNAVAELFRKCEALRSELQDQIAKANEVKGRIDTISGNESGDDEPVSDDMLVTDRLRMAKERQQDLQERMENLRKKLGRATSRELSDKEKAWSDEVRALGESVLGGGAGRGRAASPSKTKPVWERMKEVEALKEELLAEASQLEKKNGGGAGAGHDGTGSGSPARGIKMPTDLRKAKVAQMVSLLERETALVDAVKARLERLNIG